MFILFLIFVLCFFSPHLDLGLARGPLPASPWGSTCRRCLRAPAPLPVLLSPPSCCDALDALAGCDSASSASCSVRSFRLPPTEDDDSRCVSVWRRHRERRCRTGIQFPHRRRVQGGVETAAAAVASPDAANALRVQPAEPARQGPGALLQVCSTSQDQRVPQASDGGVVHAVVRASARRHCGARADTRRRRSFQAASRSAHPHRRPECRRRRAHPQPDLRQQHLHDNSRWRRSSALRR